MSPYSVAIYQSELTKALSTTAVFSPSLPPGLLRLLPLKNLFFKFCSIRNLVRPGRMNSGPRMAAHLNVHLPFLGCCAQKQANVSDTMLTGVLVFVSTILQVNWQAEPVYCVYRR